MNCAQLLYRVRSNLDAMQGPTFAGGEILSWLNDGKNAAWVELKAAKQDYFLKQMSSTDAAVTLFGLSYAPSNLQIVSGTRRYTMPPDLADLRRIRCITATRRQVQFDFADEADPDFVHALAVSEEVSGVVTDRFWVDIVGERTLSLTPVPAETLEIEIEYIPFLDDYQIYSTGTITTASGSTTVTGAGSPGPLWTAVGVTNGWELLAGIASTAITSIDPNRQYPIVASTTDTVITLQRNFTAFDGTVGGGLSYMVASPILVPRAYVNALVEYATSRGKAKDRHPDKSFYATTSSALMSHMARGAQQRQTQDPEYVEDYGHGLFGG